MSWSTDARFTIGQQLVRSADSIGANLAEGVGRGSYRDNRRFILIARGSLYETHHWLRQATKRNLLSKEDQQTLKNLLDQLTPQLNAYLKSITTRSTQANN